MYQVIMSDYFATGEGRTIHLLITRAYPSREDYDENYNVVNTPEEIAMREFNELVDPYFAQGAELLTVDELVERFSNLLPPALIKLIKSEDGHQPGNLEYFNKFHFNYS